MNTIRPFLSGMTTLAFVVAALFFARFFARSRDPLFLAFCVAFGLLAADQGLLTFYPGTQAERSWLFLLRLIAFVFIALAIVHKNFAGTEAGGWRQRPK